MAIPQALTDALAKLDTETTEIAAVVTQLRDAIKTGMTQADVDSVQSTLTALAERLDATAKDPNAPVPEGPVPVFGRGRR